MNEPADRRHAGARAGRRAGPTARTARAGGATPAPALVPVLAGLALALLGAPPAASGAEPALPPNLEPIDAAPPPPPPMRSGEVIEPDVRILEGSDGVLTEYRVGGKLVAVKVEPSAGPAYYLIDGDGDGDLDTRTRELAPDWVHAWVILRW